MSVSPNTIDGMIIGQKDFDVYAKAYAHRLFIGQPFLIRAGPHSDVALRLLNLITPNCKVCGKRLDPEVTIDYDEESKRAKGVVFHIRFEGCSVNHFNLAGSPFAHETKPAAKMVTVGNIAGLHQDLADTSSPPKTKAPKQKVKRAKPKSKAVVK